LAEQLVAPRLGLELQLLVVSKLLLKAFFALVERGHCVSACRRWFAAVPPPIVAANMTANSDDNM
jgi:hypothetical protein